MCQKYALIIGYALNDYMRLTTGVYGMVYVHVHALLQHVHVMQFVSHLLSFTPVIVCVVVAGVLGMLMCIPVVVGVVMYQRRSKGK